MPLLPFALLAVDRVPALDVVAPRRAPCAAVPDPRLHHPTAAVVEAQAVPELVHRNRIEIVAAGGHLAGPDIPWLALKRRSHSTLLPVDFSEVIRVRASTDLGSPPPQSIWLVPLKLGNLPPDEQPSPRKV